MSTGTNRVVKNSVLYSIAQVLTKASGLLLLPVYTNIKYISEAEYGEYGLLSQFVTMAIFFANLSLNNAVIRFYSDYKNDKQKCRRFFGTVMTFIIGFGIALLLLFIICRKLLIDLIFTGIDFFPGVLLTFFTLFFNTIYLMYQSMLQAMEEGERYSSNCLLFVAVHAGLNLLFLIGFKNVYIGDFHLGGGNGLIISLTISNGIFACYGIIYLLKKKLIKVCIDKEILKSSLKYSLPLLPHTVANSMAGFIPKLFLNKVDKVLNAIYSVGTQFSSVIDVVQSSINTALRPWFNDNMKRGEEGKKDIIDFSMVAFRVSVIVCLGVGLFSQEFIMLISSSPTYLEAWKIIPVLACTHAMKCIYYNHTLGIMYDIKASKFLFICSGGGTLINLALTGLFVMKCGMGIWGAAVSFFISRTVSAILTVIVCKKYRIIDFPVKKMFIIVGGCILFCAAGMLPFNMYFTISSGSEILIWSGGFFINLFYKLAIFAGGSLLIAGNQRRELAEFIKSLIKNRKKNGEKNG